MFRLKIRPYKNIRINLMFEDSLGYIRLVRSVRVDELATEDHRVKKYLQIVICLRLVLKSQVGIWDF